MNQSKHAPTIVACIVAAGFVMLLVLLVLRPITLEGNVATILTTLVGTLSAKFGDVVQFFIGSSTGSKQKDDIIAGMNNGQK